jgi:hypothetical protein
MSDGTCPNCGAVDLMIPVAQSVQREEIARLKERVAELERVLLAHRADLHEFSQRPCPTCRDSAKVLGIHDLVPGCCAQMRTDAMALQGRGEG